MLVVQLGTNHNGGAAIDLDGSVPVPPLFTLAILRDCCVRECRTVWRKDTRIGLAFVH